MFEGKTNDELMEMSAALKKEMRAVREKRKAIADELRERMLRERFASLSDAEKQVLKKMLGNVTVTPGTGRLVAEGKPIS